LFNTHAFRCLPLQFELRMALCMVRDERAEEKARRSLKEVQLTQQPAFLRGVGSLKDYQREGEVNSALHELNAC
jgi:hypothetical protein